MHGAQKAPRGNPAESPLLGKRLSYRLFDLYAALGGRDEMRCTTD
jgi:hypothetical protein